MEKLDFREKEYNINPKKDFLIIGDSLSVWMSSGLDIEKNYSKSGKTTDQMIKEIMQNQDIIKNSKVLYFLWWTNDINNNISEDKIINNIQQAVNIVNKNNIKIIIWTIPPIEKVSNWKINEANTKIKNINDYIRKNFEYIDYNQLLRDIKNPNKINPLYSAWDGVHLNLKWYKIMQEAVKQNSINTATEMIIEKSPKFQEISKQINELQKEVKEDRIKTIQEWINSLNENEKNELQKQLINVVRDIHWEKIFDDIKSWKNIEDEKIKKEIINILKEKNRENFSNSDLLTIREKWVDISSLVLIDQNNPQKIVSSKEIKEWDKFTVNFGKNESLKRKTGAWDILPPTVKTIKINGVEAQRYNNPRPGYYTINSKWRRKYQPIYDWYDIEIINIWEAKEEDFKANKLRWKKTRIEETMSNWYKPLSDNEDDKEISEIANKQKKSNIERFNSIDWEKLEKWDKWLLDFIAKAEWTDNPNGYNAIFGDANWTKLNITKMTLSEVLKAQKNHARDTWSSAFGRYQFMQYTLKEMINKYNISPNTVFDEKFQDRLAILKLKERWLDEFKAWAMSLEDFQLSLSKEWASIAKDETWLSYYHWDNMNNKATIAGRQVREALNVLYS